MRLEGSISEIRELLAASATATSQAPRAVSLPEIGSALTRLGQDALAAEDPLRLAALAEFLFVTAEVFSAAAMKLAEASETSQETAVLPPGEGSATGKPSDQTGAPTGLLRDPAPSDPEIAPQGLPVPAVPELTAP